MWFPILFVPYDTMFFASALCKVPHGAWMSLAAAALVFSIMLCWYMGRKWEDDASAVCTKIVAFYLFHVEIILLECSHRIRLSSPGSLVCDRKEYLHKTNAGQNSPSSALSPVQANTTPLPHFKALLAEYPNITR